MDVSLRPVTIAEAKATAAMIGPCDAVVRTPLVKLNVKETGGVEIWLKLENIQSISSFKVSTLYYRRLMHQTMVTGLF